MKLYFDGYRETFLTDHCIDEQGRRVLREDWETAEECREAYRAERLRREQTSQNLLAIAVGMLVTLTLLLLGA